MPKITVLNPSGTPPPIKLKPQASRPDTLDGKTIYFVNTGYIGTDRLMSVMMEWFRANYPKTNVEYKASETGMTDVDKELWQRLLQKRTPWSSALGIEVPVPPGRFASPLILNPR
jgi:hypothetical protein